MLAHLGPCSGYGIHLGESLCPVFPELEPSSSLFSLPAPPPRPFPLSAQGPSSLPVLFADANCSSAQTSMYNLPLI